MAKDRFELYFAVKHELSPFSRKLRDALLAEDSAPVESLPLLREVFFGSAGFFLARWLELHLYKNKTQGRMPAEIPADLQNETRKAFLTDIARRLGYQIQAEPNRDYPALIQWTLRNGLDMSPDEIDAQLKYHAQAAWQAVTHSRRPSGEPYAFHAGI